MTDTGRTAGFDPGRPNAARMFDYYLGGKDNFAVDRAAADAVLAAAPEMGEAARQGRELIARIVEHLVTRCGIRQIIDLGSGLPTQENVHQVAQRLASDVRVVYVDNDDLVCAHGRALLSRPEQVLMVQRDLRQPDTILNDAQINDFVDFRQPVAVLMMYVLHLLAESDDPDQVVADYRAALAPGSYLAISHASNDARPDFMARISAIYQQANTPFTPRSKEAISSFFVNFELEPPGIVTTWPFTEPPATMPAGLVGAGYSGVARKPRTI